MKQEMYGTSIRNANFASKDYNPEIPNRSFGLLITKPDGATGNVVTVKLEDDEGNIDSFDLNYGYHPIMFRRIVKDASNTITSCIAIY